MRTTAFCHIFIFRGSYGVSTLIRSQTGRNPTSRICCGRRNEDSLALGELDCAADFDLGLGDLDHIQRIPFEMLDMIDVGLCVHDVGIDAVSV